MHDELGDRMKQSYEDRTRFLLPRRTYTIIRVDGKAFHTFTKGFKRPYDGDLMTMMDNTAIALCEAIQGSVLAYTQSDEISVLLTDFAKPSTNAWFDGNVQKQCSIAAACATMAFNNQMLKNSFSKDNDHEMKTDVLAILADCFKMAMFDARVFTIPDPVEVENYLIWRQNDASRNSVQMAARAVYSHKALEGKGIPELHELLHQKGINWNDYTSGEKRGRAIVRRQYPVDIKHGHGGALPEEPLTVMRNKWVSLSGGTNEETPLFTRDRSFLRNLIPLLPGVNFVSDEPKGQASPYDCG